jgi:predicted amidohydrolase
VGKYRKTHLPHLGVDRFVAPGDAPLDVYDTAIGRIGLNICFDVRFPEPARVLALNGADLIALPTNWPEGAESAPDYLVNARAIENRVTYVAVDREGAERGFRFIGRSKIVDYRGQTLAEASPDREAIIYDTLDLELARDKHVVVTPGEYELPLFTGRRPELYAALVERWD